MRISSAEIARFVRIRRAAAKSVVPLDV